MQRDKRQHHLEKKDAHGMIYCNSNDLLTYALVPCIKFMNFRKKWPQYLFRGTFSHDLSNKYMQYDSVVM